MILFNYAAMLDLAAVVRRGHVTLRLLAIGIPLSIVLGTGVVLLTMPIMPLWEAVCLATIVAPTEVALIDALIEDRRIPERVRHALSTESGFYDGFALTAMLAALALASEQAHPEPGRWELFAVRTELVSLVVGLVIGVIGGLVIVWSRQRRWMSDTWAQLATVALALVCFEVGERLHGSGFVTAFAGGLAYSMMVRKADTEIPSQVTDAAGELLELVVFAMFGSYAVFVGWRDADWRVVLFAVVALIVVRLVAVWLALIGSDLSTRSRLFVGWFGPRGIATLVLGLLMIERGEIQQSAVITQAVVVTVTVSLVIHRLSTPLGIRRWPNPPPEKAGKPVSKTGRLGPGTIPRPPHHPRPPPGPPVVPWVGRAARPSPAWRSPCVARAGLSPS